MSGTATNVMVRRATGDDAAGIARVQVWTWHATFRGLIPDGYLDKMTVEQRTASWRETLERGEPLERRTFVAVQAGAGDVVVGATGGEVVGFAAGGRERDGDAEYDGELYAIYILQEQQRAGVGRALTCAVVDTLLEMRCRAMLVWALEVNDAGRRFYEKLGGELVRRDTLEGEFALPVVGYGWRDVRALRDRLVGTGH